MDMYQITLVVDEKITNCQRLYEVVGQPDRTIYHETPDGKYTILKWETDEKYIFEEIQEAVNYDRHILIVTDEESVIINEHKTWDEYGTDEEFADLIKPVVNVCWFDNDPLDFQLEDTFYENDYDDYFEIEEEAEILENAKWYIYESLKNAGCSNEMISNLGLGYLIAEEKTDDR